MGKADTGDMILSRILDDRLSCTDSGLSELAREILSARRSHATIETYRSEWARFVDWATEHGPIDYPIAPKVLATYLTWLHANQYGRSTIRKTITVMGLAHDEKDNPCGDRLVRELIKGILRKDKRPTKKARPLSLAELLSICDKLTDKGDEKALRDRALISLGWMAALRASELVALEWRDVVEVETGIELHIRESKTNQSGDVQIIALPLLANAYQIICPVRNLRAIYPTDLDHPRYAADLPVFLSYLKSEAPDYVVSTRLNKRSVSRIIERSAKLARLEGKFSSHCLRRGFATFAASKGLSDFQIMRHGRWKSVGVAAGYVELSKLWSDNPLSILLGDKAQ